MNEKKWLPHILPEIAIENRNRVCAYLVALEGWRRGLNLTWYSKNVKNNKVHAPGRYFSLSNENKIHYFYKSKGDLTDTEAQRITGRKHLTKEILSEAGVSVPKGKMFKKEVSDLEIISYANSLGYPLVLKPTNGFQGNGVFANLKNEQELKGALEHLRNDMGYKEVIIEQFIDGVEYRIFVIGEKVIGAIEKIPPIIVGDGMSTVKQLIQQKNKEKKKNPHLVKKPIKIDYEVESCIKEAGYNLDSVLNAGVELLVRKKNSLSSGGDPVDATDFISASTIETSIKALNAIPNLSLGGLDVMVNQDTDEAYVIEINAIPMIGSHLFPEIGIARDVPSAIIDYYFPETKNQPRKNDNVYFDFNTALQPLHSKTVSEVIMQATPSWNDFCQTKLVVKGKVQGVGYRRWARRKALENDLYGHVENKRDGSVVIAVTGERNDIENFKHLCLTGPKKASVTEIDEVEWTGPLKVGFEIKDTKKKSKPKKKKVQPKTAPVKQSTKSTTIASKIKRAIFKKK